MSYRERLAADRRLVILQHIAQEPTYELGAPILRIVLAELPHRASSELVDSDLAWLARMSLITRREIGGTSLCKLTQRGLDVARGLESEPGVQALGPAP